ncbi:hypothetical protein NDU88_006197 [Pleurodeles waltl]|uniref:Uncharacterized protein n=1 Tax=Pleurodeles waltl TaxID=8319 RepID=A0AAV7VQD1_PLEWA|nr:hypothetical protein NDU88_006197 [Pleurodeles waltl]
MRGVSAARTTVAGRAALARTRLETGGTFQENKLTNLITTTFSLAYFIWRRGSWSPDARARAPGTGVAALRFPPAYFSSLEAVATLKPPERRMEIGYHSTPREWPCSPELLPPAAEISPTQAKEIDLYKIKTERSSAVRGVTTGPEISGDVGRLCGDPTESESVVLYSRLQNLLCVHQWELDAFRKRYAPDVCNWRLRVAAHVSVRFMLGENQLCSLQERCAWYLQLAIARCDSHIYASYVRKREKEETALLPGCMQD